MNTKHIIDYFVQAFPAANQDEQQLSLTLYRQLALGNPVSVGQLHTVRKLTRLQINYLLHTWPGVFFNDEDNVIGFWGMAIQEMPHQLKINEHTVYTWCAWDTLFIPELIGTTVKVTSTCPVTARQIKLIVSPTRVKAVNNTPIFLSFLIPDTGKINDDVTVTFCQFVHFFDSKLVADKWIAEHPDTFLLSLDDAFFIAKQVNAVRYNLTLH